MKTILLILGANGVGKSTTARSILDRLLNSALVDSDWCRAMNPYDMDTVINNMYGLIKNYFDNEQIKTVILPYGFHGDRKKRYDIVMSKLQTYGMNFTVYPVILTCSYDEIIYRSQKDMRDEERIKRGMKNTFHFYDEYDYPKIDTTTLTVEQAAEKIIALFK